MILISAWQIYIAPFHEVGKGQPLHIQSKRVLCNLYTKNFSRRSAMQTQIVYQHRNNWSLKYPKYLVLNALIVEKHDIRYLRINFQCKKQMPCTRVADSIHWREIHFTQKSWHDGSTSGLKQPVSDGKRLVIVHVGEMEGFVPNALFMYEAHKKARHYLDNMNFNNHSKLIKTQLIPNLKPISFVVLDIACTIIRFKIRHQIRTRESKSWWIGSLSEILTIPQLYIRHNYMILYSKINETSWNTKLIHF